jgi:predicted ATPase
VLRWAAADTAAAWKGCTKKLLAISRQLSVGLGAPLASGASFFADRSLGEQMHLSSINVRNFRSLTELSMEFADGANLIVGPNAVGKTTVLEAIRLAKAVLAPRTAQESGQVLVGLGATSQQLRQMFNFGAIAKDAAKPVEITCKFRLREAEVAVLDDAFGELCRAIVAAQRGISLDAGPFSLVQFLSSPIGRAAMQSVEEAVRQQILLVKESLECTLGLSISPARGVAGSDLFSQALFSVLENRLSPSRSRFSYFPADRALPHGEMPIQLGAFDAAQELESHNSTPATKYQRLKNTIFTWIANSPDGKAELDKAFSQIFDGLLKSRKMHGFGVNQYGQASIKVMDKETGEVFDIDAMSSGEKGLILTFLVIARSAERGGLVLIDEPELHLNPAVCKLLLAFLVEEYLTPNDLQAIICSHSSEILGTAMRREDCAVYHLRRGPVVSKIRKKDQPEVARALRLLGTSEVEEMLYEGTVFVEGEDDVDLMEEAFPESLARVKFKDLSGRGEVEKQIKRLQQAEKKGQKENISYFIFDHDRKPTTLASTEKVRVKQWVRYCIENYLLEPEILFDVLSKERCKKFPAGLGEAEALFKEVAQRQLQYQAVRETYQGYGYSDTWAKDVAKEVVQAKDLPGTAAVLFDRLALIRGQLSTLQGEQWRQEFVSRCGLLIEEREPTWRTEWRVHCSGKKFFKDLYSECGISADPLVLKRRILKECKFAGASAWKEMEKEFTGFVADCLPATHQDAAG